MDLTQVDPDSEPVYMSWSNMDLTQADPDSEPVYMYWSDMDPTQVDPDSEPVYTGLTWIQLKLILILNPYILV